MTTKNIQRLNYISASCQGLPTANSSGFCPLPISWTLFPPICWVCLYRLSHNTANLQDLQNGMYPFTLERSCLDVSMHHSQMPSSSLLKCYPEKALMITLSNPYSRLIISILPCSFILLLLNFKACCVSSYTIYFLLSSSRIQNLCK